MAPHPSTNWQNWSGFTDVRFGYGAMWAGFIENLPIGVKMDESASVMVHMGIPMSCKGALDGAFKVLYTMWETDQLPPRFIAWLNQYDRVLVPCEHNVEPFARYHPDVRYVPLGVDQAVWRPQKRQTNPVYRIHAGGSLWGRKGLDIVVEACRRLKFPHDLHIKLAPHAKDHPDLSTIRNVTFDRNWMTEAQHVAYMNQADLFVAPSRGEGFGLIPLQAIACGIPTIITATSGQAQFAHLATGVVPHTRIKTQHGYWDDADPKDLADAITEHHETRNDKKTQAMSTIALVDEFSWAKAAEKLVAQLPVGKLLKDAQFKELQPSVKFKVNRKVQSSINGKEKTFLPGVEYVDGEGQFQVLWEGGYIDKGQP